ncbi:MAG: GGDEF domain-containing protein [Nitriliruptoraceae bacterium]|nr:GGDEF domain-containing protein [Nitriliruptoraceae bacterium]
MSRPSLSSRTRATLLSLAGGLASRPVRFSVVGTGLAVTVVLHAALGDPRIAWAAAPLVLIAGLAGGVRSPLILASIAAAGHLAADLFIGLSVGELLGVAIRSVVLPGIALVGMAGQHVERQRGIAMQRAASEDAVTGLLNVRAFYDHLEHLRAAEEPFTIVLADIRGMRALNERYGHPTGTEAMRALAHVLRRSAGTEVRASRLGSDEVAVALLGADRSRARAVIDAVIERLHDELVTLPDGERFEVHAAYGIARFPEDGEDAVTVLRAADRAKERAKTAGLDRIGLADGEVV